MRKLIATTFLTLDGVMQAPGGPGEDDDAGFSYGGWSFPFWDDRGDEFMSNTILGKPFDLVLGRRTYDIFAGYWPTAPDEAVGKPFNDATKYVASRGSPALTWANSVLIEGDAADGVAKLKQQDGPELQVHGSGNLLQTLIRHDLVDRFYIWVCPVMLGEGKRLFADGTIPKTLELVDHLVTSKGVVIGTYEPRGEVEVGTFE